MQIVGKPDRVAKERVWLGRLLWVEPFYLLVLASALLFPGRFWTLAWHPTLVILLFLFWPLRLGVERRLSVRTPVDWALALLGAQVAVAVWVSPLRDASWEAAGYLLVGLVGYVALVNWPPLRRRPARSGWIVLAAGGGVAVLGALLLSAPSDKLGATLAAPSWFGSLAVALGEPVNPNVLAGALVLVAPLCWALAVEWRWTRRPWPLLWGVAGVAVTVELALTQCRGAYLAVALALAVLICVRWPRLSYGVAPLAVVGGALALSTAGVALLLDTVGGGGSGLGGLDDRMAIWQRGLQALGDFRATGIGLGLFASRIPVLYPYSEGAGWSVTHAHNWLLQVGVDLGVTGLVAYTALLLGVAVMLVRTLRRRPVPDAEASDEERRRTLHWALAAGSLAALVGMLVHGVVDATLWGNKLAFLPWLLFALATNMMLGAYRRRVRVGGPGRQHGR